jgi:hypothetical protein
MKYSILTLTLLILFSSSLFAQSPKAPQILEKGAFEIGEQLSFYSEELKENRTLNIYLPAAYHQDSTAAFPVVYLLDGSAHEDFLHVVGLLQFFELQFHMPPTIVVGISNVDRKRDFTFYTEDKEMLGAIPTGGGSAQFMAFVEKELQPFVEANYRTAEPKTLIGQSLGGLMASEFLLKKPDLFTRYIIVSPSLWWDNQSLLHYAPRLMLQHPYENTQVYISVGKEGKVMERDAKELYETLKAGKKESLDLHFLFMPKENHATILHNSIYEALMIFYPFEKG